VISNEDYLYVLTVFIVEPARWIERCGFRPLHRNELDSFHLKYMNIGLQMGIQQVPKTFEEAAHYMDSYEEKYMNFHPANAKLAASTTALFLSSVPSIFHPPAQRVLHALCPSRLRKAMGFAEPPVWASTVARAALAIAQLTHRHLLLPRWRILRRTQYVHLLRPVMMLSISVSPSVTQSLTTIIPLAIQYPCLARWIEAMLDDLRCNYLYDNVYLNTIEQHVTHWSRRNLFVLC
jgi:hypothetical protein